MKTCPSCYSPVKDTTRFCPVCGYDCQETLTEGEREVYDRFASDLRFVYGKRRRKSGVLIHLTAVVALLAAAAMIVWMVIGLAVPSFGLYLNAQNQLALYNVDSGASMVLANAADGEDVIVTADGLRVFYPVKRSGELIALAFRPTEGGEETVVAEGVSEYCVSENGETVLYMTADKTLYRATYTEQGNTKTKLLKNVTNAAISVDGGRVLAVDNTDSVYIAQGDGAVTKILNNVKTIETSDNAMSECYFLTRDNKLFMIDSSVEPKKVAHNVSSIVCVTANRECYYTKDEDAYAPRLADFVENDDDAADNALIEQLNATAYEVDCTALYCYAAAATTKLTDAMVTDSMSFDAVSGLLAFREYEHDRFDKLPLSKVASADHLKESIDKAFGQCVGDHSAYRGKMYPNDHREVTLLAVAKDGKKAVVSAKAADGSPFFGYSSISGGVIGPITKIADGAFDSRETVSKAYVMNDGTTVVLHDAMLYVNENELDAGVGEVVMNDNHTAFLYHTGYDSTGTASTLYCCYQGGTATKVADNVGDAVFLDDGEILLIGNYQPLKHIGVAYVYEHGEKTEIGTARSPLVSRYVWQQPTPPTIS